MTFHASSNRRERILIYGPAGSGKSTDYISIADMFWRTSTNQRLHLWDSDVTWEAIRPVDGHLDQFFNVHDIDTFEDWLRASKAAKEQANPNREDWLVIDMASSLYKSSKRDFFQRAYGTDYDDFFIGAGMNPGNVGGSYGVNHHVINERYDKVFSVIHRYPGHVLCICEEADVWLPDKTGKGGDDSEIRTLYERVMKKPAGRDGISHAFHTIIRQVEASENKYIMQGIKDRQRVRVKGATIPTVENGGFAMSYLVNVAGWVIDQ